MAPSSAKRRTVNSTARPSQQQPSFGAGDVEMPSFNPRDFFVADGSAPSSKPFFNPEMPGIGPASNNTVSQVQASTGDVSSEPAGPQKIVVAPAPVSNLNQYLPGLAALAIGYFVFQAKGPVWGVAAAGAGYLGAKRFFK